MIYYVIPTLNDRTTKAQIFLRMKRETQCYSFVMNGNEITSKDILPPNNLSMFIKQQQEALTTFARYFLTEGQGRRYVFPRNSSNTHVRPSSYIAELGLILPLTVPLHSDYQQTLASFSKQGFFELDQRNLNWQETELEALSPPTTIDNMYLSISAQRLLKEVRRLTNLDANECYVTCSSLTQLYGLSRAGIDKIIKSPLVKTYLTQRKLSGSKNIGFEWTEFGLEYWVSQYKNVRSKFPHVSERHTHPGFKETYAFDTHVALIKRLGDEYKKALTDRCQIPEIKREAAISLALLDAM
ncbi:hypothetical protein L1D19_23325 [Vibrio natriegens]|uniref:hypothetical protein n=1 Tax=Vibrio natriegens TaxID=691 RepID=UPI001EFD69AA|nr:hypothetical protein [Vibrio natriegens]MCG9703000.1 hypothetical protein [Vibrio natriegens]